MASSLDNLLAGSEGLAGSLDDERALTVNAAILEADPHNAVATNRLGIGLLYSGRAAEAVEVFKAGLETHPDNPIMLRRLDEARRAVERALVAETVPASRRGRAGRKGQAEAWIKAVYHNPDGWTVAPGQESWISDPGNFDDRGERVYRADGQPSGEPSWRIGDSVGLYFGGTYRVPVLVEIIERPRFDPAFVAKESGSPQDGERWPWVTPIRGVASLPVDDAPTLTDLGIAHASMQQRSRLRLDAARREVLLRLLGKS
jgi:hypothetical protein